MTRVTPTPPEEVAVDATVGDGVEKTVAAVMVVTTALRVWRREHNDDDVDDEAEADDVDDEAGGDNDDEQK